MFNSTSGSICSEVVPKQEDTLLEGEKVDEEQWASWEKQLMDDDYATEEHPSRLRDIERSRKFYLRRREHADELEDVFVERTSENYDDSEDEEIIKVVLYEGGDEDAIQHADLSPTPRKKSNSKFTLSVCSGVTSSLPDDDSSGDDLSDGESVVGGGRFLEAKDSIEVMATSSKSLKSLRSGHNKSSDWDEPAIEEVSCVWYSEEQANEAGFSQAQCLEAKEGLGNLGEEVCRSRLERTKHVSFHESSRSDDSVRSDETFCVYNPRDDIGERPAINDSTVCNEGVGETSSKSTASNSSSKGKRPTKKRVSFHDLPQDETSRYEGCETTIAAEVEKTKEVTEERTKVDTKSKRVSFHKLYIDSEEQPLCSPCLECFDRERDGVCDRCGAAIFRIGQASSSNEEPDISNAIGNDIPTLVEEAKETRCSPLPDSSEETIRSVLARGQRSSSSPHLATSDVDTLADSDRSILDITSSLFDKKASTCFFEGAANMSNVNILETSHYVLGLDNQLLKDSSEDQLDQEKEDEKVNIKEADESGPEEKDISSFAEGLTQLQPNTHENSECTHISQEMQAPVISEEVFDNQIQKGPTVDSQPELVGSCCVVHGASNEAPNNIKCSDLSNSYIGEETSESYITCESEIRPPEMSVHDKLSADIFSKTGTGNIAGITDISQNLVMLTVGAQNVDLVYDLKNINEMVSPIIVEPTSDVSSLEDVNVQDTSKIESSDSVSAEVVKTYISFDAAHERNIDEECTNILINECLVEEYTTDDLEESNRSVPDASEEIKCVVKEVESTSSTEVIGYQLLLNENLANMPLKEDPTLSFTTDESIHAENCSTTIEINSITSVDLKSTDLQSTETITDMNTSIDQIMNEEVPKTESTDKFEDGAVMEVYNLAVKLPINQNSSESGIRYQPSLEEAQLHGSSELNVEKNVHGFEKRSISRPEEGTGSGDDWPYDPSSKKNNEEAPFECSAGDLCLKGSACTVHRVQSVNFSNEEYESAESDSSGFNTP